MYIFVLVWGGAVASAAPSGSDVPFGKIFSCLMAACAVGSALFSLLSSINPRPEAFLQPVLLSAAVALYAAAHPPSNAANAAVNVANHIGGATTKSAKAAAAAAAAAAASGAGVGMSPLAMLASPAAALASLPTWLYLVRTSNMLHVYKCYT